MVHGFILQEILLSVVMFQFFTKSSEEPRIALDMSNIGPDNALSSLILTLLTHSAYFFQLIFSPFYRWLILILNAEASEISNLIFQFIYALILYHAFCSLTA